MEPNKFEHSAKLLLDEFTIHPTDKVWTNIQPQIKTKKSSNKFVALILLFVITFLLSNFNLYDLANHLPSKNQNSVVVKPSTKNQVNNSDILESEDLILQNKKQLQKNTIVQTNVIQNNVEDELYVNRVNRNASQYITNKPNQLSDNNTIVPIPSNEFKVADVKIENSKSSTNDMAIGNATIEQVDTLNNANKIVGLIEVKENTKPKINVTDTTVNQKNTTIKAKKWLWVISCNAGIAAVSSGLFKNSSNVYLNSSDFTSGIGTGTPAGIDLFSTAIKPSFTFYIEAQAQYVMSNKSAFMFGLQYNYTSNKIKILPIGNVTPNNNTRLSDALQVNGYTNQFHFIEVPFAYVYSFKKNNQTVWQFQVGGSIAHLLKSNALQLNNDEGVFYKDNSILHKSFFSANASILYNLTKKAKSPILIGPSYSLYLTPLSSSGLYNQVYTSLLGIKIQKYLSKK